MADVNAALASPEGQAAAGDLANFASGGATLLIYDVRLSMPEVDSISDGQSQAGRAYANSFAQEVGSLFRRQGEQGPDLVAQRQLTLFLESFQLRPSSNASFLQAFSPVDRARRYPGAARPLSYF